MDMEMQPQAPPPMPQPSIPIEPEVDNSEIHIEVIRAWANSDEGMEAKKFNPNGYANVIAHLQQHLAVQAQQMEQEAAAIKEDKPEGPP
jgi:enhancing lycopene biosynthesis protein 2